MNLCPRHQNGDGNDEYSKGVVCICHQPDDFEGLAKAYRDSEIAWSVNEWKEFIAEIRKQERKRIEEELKHIAMHHVIQGHGMYSVADVLEVLNKKV